MFCIIWSWVFGDLGLAVEDRSTPRDRDASKWEGQKARLRDAKVVGMGVLIAGLCEVGASSWRRRLNGVGDGWFFGDFWGEPPVKPGAKSCRECGMGVFRFLRRRSLWSSVVVL